MRKLCPKCGRELPLDAFNKNRTRKFGVGVWCRDCSNKANRKRYWERHEHSLERLRVYREQNRELLAEKQRKYYRENTEKVAAQRLAARVKAMVKLADPIKCVRCSLDDVRILVIDHVHNDGEEERARMCTDTIYRNIIKMSVEEARERYQVLCHNCNWLKRLDVIAGRPKI